MGNKKNLLVETIKLAMSVSKKFMSDYGAIRSRKDFTQGQLMGCLVLRAYLKTTYRGVIEYLETSDALRKALGFEDKLPHYSTLAKFADRSAVLEIMSKIVSHLGVSALKHHPQPVAMDATGLETSAASAHFMSRSGRDRKKWVKVSAAILCTSLIPLGAVMGWGPGNDKSYALPLIEVSFSQKAPEKVFADAGYDAEWIHGVLQEDYGIKKTVIKPARMNAEGKMKGRYRSKMTKHFLTRHEYGKRWSVETYFSALKRKVGSTLNARKESNLLKEAAFKILAYAFHR